MKVWGVHCEDRYGDESGLSSLHATEESASKEASELASKDDRTRGNWKHIAYVVQEHEVPEAKQSVWLVFSNDQNSGVGIISVHRTEAGAKRSLERLNSDQKQGTMSLDIVFDILEMPVLEE